MSTKERISAVIDSRVRPNYNTTAAGNFVWNFDKGATRITEIMIDYISIPYTYYAINSTNNQIVINSQTITVTPGNYTATSLIPVLITAIDGVIGGTTTITYSTTTYKFTITHSAAITIQSETTSGLRLATLLGYRVTTGAGTTHTSDSVANLAGPPYLLLEIPYFAKAKQHKTMYADDTMRNVIQTIPVNAEPGGEITFSRILPIRLNYKFSIASTDNITIKLYDDRFNVIDLNGENWSIHLTFITE